jgi:hypothetical protein
MASRNVLELMAEAMIYLLIAGVVAVLVLLALAERVLKARARARRLQEVSDRLVAVAARVDEQQEARRAEARASAALTSVMPAIKRPPLGLPGLAAHGAARPKPGCERPGQVDHAPQAAEHTPRTGEHPVRAAEQHGPGRRMPQD